MFGFEPSYSAKKALETFKKNNITNIIKKRSKENNLNALIKVENHDIRKKLNCDNENFQACYSHMLFCMALTNQDL